MSKINNIDRLPKNILGDIRQYHGAKDENDNSVDEKINKMSNTELFDSYLEWNGYINFRTELTEVIKNIFNIKLE